MSRVNFLADGPANPFEGLVVEQAKPKKPPKPKLAFNPELLHWFEILEQHPDRLGIVADWCDDNAGYDKSIDLIGPAIRFAWNHGRWPVKTALTKWEPHPNQRGNRRVPTGEFHYHWIVTPKPILIWAADCCWLSTSNHKFAITFSKKRRVGFLSVRRHSSKDILRYRTKGTTLIESFRQLAILLEPGF